jgi:hypothetical protein
MLPRRVGQVVIPRRTPSVYRPPTARMPAYAGRMDRACWCMNVVSEAIFAHIGRFYEDVGFLSEGAPSCLASIG